MALPPSVKLGNQMRSQMRSQQRDEVRSFSGQIKRETDKAILMTLHLPDEDDCGDPVIVKKDVWFPLSQVKSIHHTFSIVNDTLDSIVVSLWIAQQKELA